MLSVARKNRSVLRCPHCKREIGHQDRNGGPGVIVLNRYLRILPDGEQFLVACRKCGSEVAPRHLIEKLIWLRT